MCLCVCLAVVCSIYNGLSTAKWTAKCLDNCKQTRVASFFFGVSQYIDDVIHLPLISFRPTNKIMAITFAIDSEYNSQRAHFAQKMLLTFDNITKLVEEKGGCWKRPAAPKRERGV